MILSAFPLETNKEKVAAYLWSAASILFFVTIVLYVFVLQPSGDTGTERTSQLLEKWTLASAIWRMETLAVVLITVSSWYFATARQSMSWFLIAFAHIVMVTMYASMLGSYPVAADAFAESPYLFPMVNNTAVWIFGLSNLLFLTGLAFVYVSEELPSWMRWAGGIISSVGAFAALALFLDLITFSDLVMIGPLFLALYLLNAYMGIKLANQEHLDQQQ
jgi:hypothetical protein